MKKLSGSFLWICFVCGAITGCLSFLGCSSTPHPKNDAAAVSMQSAAAEVQAESRALELTMGALKDLIEEPQTDLKVPFQNFSTSLDRLIAAAHRTSLTSQRLAKKNAAYLQAWDKELATIDFEKVRNLSQTRKTEVTDHFAKLDSRYQENQQAIDPLITYLQDIRKALGSDLTSAGVMAIKPIAENANDNAAKVQTALSALSAELNNSSVLLSSVVPQQLQQQ